MLIRIELYIARSGKSPVKTWLDELDCEFIGRINDRLKRIKYGNFGDYKNLGEGVFELRFHFGPGYRIYFGKDGDKVIILLCAGEKSSQSHDIKKAKFYWEEYQNV
jgi:putative addiction module killer protein